MGTPQKELDVLAELVDKAIRLYYPYGFPNGCDDQLGFYGDVVIRVNFQRNQVHSVNVNGRRFIKKELSDNPGD